MKMILYSNDPITYGRSPFQQALARMHVISVELGFTVSSTTMVMIRFLKDSGDYFSKRTPYRLNAASLRLHRTARNRLTYTRYSNTLGRRFDLLSIPTFNERLARTDLWGGGGGCRVRRIWSTKRLNLPCCKQTRSA